MNLKKLKKLPKFQMLLFIFCVLDVCGLKILDYLIVKLVLVFVIAGVVSCRLAVFVKWQTISFYDTASE